MRQLFLAVAVSSFTAIAGSAASAETVRVRIDKNMLASEAGVIEIYDTLEAKSGRACRTIRLESEEKACRVSLVQQFIDAIGDARLTAFFEGDHAITVARLT